MPMTNFFLRRLFTTALVVLGVSFAVFMIVHLVPGDPVRVMLGKRASPEAVERLRHLMGFDRPLLIQYGDWLWRALHGDLGQSVINGMSVAKVVWQRFPATLSLALTSLIIAWAIALPAGMISALKSGSPVDYGAMLFSQLGASVPSFWLGIVFILFFSLYLGWLPTSGYTSPVEHLGNFLKHLILPAATVGLIYGAILTRFVRSAILEVLNENYVRTARAKGLPEALVIRRHVLTNAAIPLVTLFGMGMAGLLSGVTIVEIIFAWPGLGRLALDAVSRRDYPMLQGAVLVFSLNFTVMNLIVDLLYTYLDPRIEH